MNFRSIADLNSDIKQWISDLPNDLDLIVGIPRSGLLVANLLALYTNLPLTDVEGLCKNRVFQAGHTYKHKKNPDLSKPNKVLVVDDSVCYGNQMKRVKSKLKNANLPHQIYYATVYVSSRSQRSVNFWYEIVDLPRVFEWNIIHHSVLVNSCVDIDGVLCRDPSAEENDDGENYQRFLINVKPLIVPTEEIGWLVTCRLEKYRFLTEEWLKKYNIRYKHLIMMNLPSKEARIELGNYSSFKARIYKKAKALLFIESSHRQAQEIARLAYKPVYCVGMGQMYKPTYLAECRRRGRTFMVILINNPFNALCALTSFLKARIRKLCMEAVGHVRKKNLQDKSFYG